MFLTHPWLLLLLVIPALLLVFQWRVKSRVIPVPFDHQPHRSRRFLGFFLDLASSLPALILAAVIILLCGPRRFEQPENEREMTNIQFCLDVSGSMMAGFGNGTRYDAAMVALNQFLTYRKGDAFGLLFFGDHNCQWAPLTTDVSAFKHAPPFFRPSNLPKWFRGGTSIGKALKKSEEILLSAEEGDRMIVLVSDGQSGDLFNGKDVKIAQSLKDNNVILYGIHVAEGAPPDTVALMASMTGGEVFAAGDPNALQTVFQSIDAMQQAPIKRRTPDPVDFFEIPALVALGLAALWLLSLFKLRYTPW
jgi:Ca-activated chloride channel family protein